MRTVILVCFILLALPMSCSTVGRQVRFPDESEKTSAIWACFNDDETKDGLVCLDLKDFLKYLASRPSSDRSDL